MPENIAALLRAGALSLPKTICPLPWEEAEYLLALALGESREHLLAHPDGLVSCRQQKRFKTLLFRRAQGEPYAYLSGHKEFYGLDFQVNRQVLIPRPETELLVEEAQRIMPLNKKTVIMDIGTGSGAIIIALAKIFDCARPAGKNRRLPAFFAVDISAPALRLARQNAVRQKVKKSIKFLQGDLLCPIFRFRRQIMSADRLLVIANLPYLTPAQIRHSPSIRFEPKSALNGGRDGLRLYRHLFRQLKNFLGQARPLKTKKNLPAQKIKLLCEIDPAQKNKFQKLVKKYLPAAGLTFKKDLKGHNRLAILEWPRL